MKKLLFIMSNLQSGGAERSLVNLLQLLDTNKYQVSLLLFQKKGIFLKQVPASVRILQTPEDLCLLYDLKESTASGFMKKIMYTVCKYVSTILCRLASGRGLKHKQIRWKYFYSRLINSLEEEYDIAAAYLHGEQIYYLIDKVKARKKIGWVHNEYTKSGLSARKDKRYFDHLDEIVTISDVCADILRELFPENQNKIKILPNLTSSAVIRKMAEEFIPQEYPPEDKGELILVSIGRLTEQKGFDIALEAAFLLMKHHFPFKWFVIGSGVLEPELKNKCNSLKLTSNFFFIGPRENPYPYLKWADIVVQTSRWEGKSIVLDEAKILAKPMIATNYTTISDQLTPQEGMIVGMNAESVAAGIIRMSDKKEYYHRYLSKNIYGNEQEIDKYYKLFG